MTTAIMQHSGSGRFSRMVAVFGPGLVVMLADTDVGSVITAGQSGVQWGYRLLLLQLLLVPILYMVQELTVRLGIFTGRGHGELIRDTFGPVWAWVSAVGLGVSTVGALLTEFSGVAGVGELYGLPRFVSLPVAAVALLAVVLTGSYRRVERAAIAVGLFELAFFAIAWMAHPDLGAMARGAIDIPFANRDYLYLAAANIGAVIMPWMIFYQQEAVIDKGRRGLSIRSSLRSARLDTALGAVVTQIVMVAVVVASAATLGVTHQGRALDSIGAIANALTPFLGHRDAVIFFGLGMIGASVVAALVVTLAGAWGISEVLGWRHSLNDSPIQAAGFYALAVGGTLSGAVLVLVVPNLVNLSVDVEVMNACLLPIVLGFLLALERRALPPELRMRGARRVITYALTNLVILFGLFTLVLSLHGAIK